MFRENHTCTYQPVGSKDYVGWPLQKLEFGDFRFSPQGTYVVKTRHRKIGWLTPSYTTPLDTQYGPSFWHRLIESVTFVWQNTFNLQMICSLKILEAGALVSRKLGTLLLLTEQHSLLWALLWEFFVSAFQTDALLTSLLNQSAPSAYRVCKTELQQQWSFSRINCQSFRWQEAGVPLHWEGGESNHGRDVRKMKCHRHRSLASLCFLSDAGIQGCI